MSGEGEGNTSATRVASFETDAGLAPPPPPPPPPDDAAAPAEPHNGKKGPASSNAGAADATDAGAAGAKLGAALGRPRSHAASAAAAAGRPVVLRVEVASAGLARLLMWAVWALNVTLGWVAISLLSLREADFWEAGQLRVYYLSEVIIGGAMLGALCLQLAWLALAIRRTKRQGRTWSVRQRYFTRSAVTLLLLQTGETACYTLAYSATYATPNCGYPWHLLAVTEFLQFFCFASILLYMLARLMHMRLWTGAGALDMHPDFRLSVDRPLRDRTRQLWIVGGVWLVLMALGLMNMVEKIVRPRYFEGGCDQALSAWDCPPTSVQVVNAAVFLGCFLLFVAYWAWTVYKALQDHERLPWAKYRATLMFVRIQARLFGPVLSCVLFSTVCLSLIPAFNDSCWSAVDAQIGNLPVTLALTIAALVFTYLYAPTSQAQDSTQMQEFNGRFAWTQASMAAEAERRNSELVDAPLRAAALPGSQVSFTQVMEFLPDQFARLAGEGSPEGAEALRREPLFCFETAVRLFYWQRLAYRETDALDHPFVNARRALPLFDLSHFEIIWDDTTDTHACVGWSATQAVVAFRGTQTLQNVLTDLRAWLAPLQPEQRHGPRGQLLKVHAGFLKAWYHHGFNTKVLARLRALAAAAPKALRFWVTGHSLGGALAVLAALDLRREHPESQLTCYTYGCPRIGNGAFHRAVDAALPDCWALATGLDPVPWLPKFGFHSAGKRVTMDMAGNLMLRPTYFELSVTHRGNSPRHHLAASYAQALAAVLRAQFVESKALPGGAKGVAALAGAVSLEACLVLTNMSLEALADPKAPPESKEALAAKQAALAAKKQGAAQRRQVTSVGATDPAGPGAGARCACWRGGSSGGDGEEEEDRGEAVADVVDGGGSGEGGSEGGAAPLEDGSVQEVQWWHLRHWRRLLQPQEEQPGGSPQPPRTARRRASVLPRPAAKSSRVRWRRYDAVLEAPAGGSVDLAPAGSGVLSAAAAADGAAAAVDGGGNGAAAAAGSARRLVAPSFLSSVSMSRALSQPDSIVLDAESGGWLQLAPSGGSGPSRLSSAARDSQSRLDLSPLKPAPTPPH